MQWPQLRDEIGAAASRVADLLRAMPSGDTRLQRVDWTAAETGAHLVGLTSRYRRMLDAPTLFPASLAAENEEELTEVPERDPEKLADMLVTEIDDLLEVLGHDGTRKAYYFGIEATVHQVGGLALDELLMHGLDLATALGRPWPITREQAVAGIESILPLIARMADPESARDAEGVYHLHLRRGGGDWTLAVADGAATLAKGRPPRADLHFSVNPKTFLLNAFNHISRARAVFSGGMLLYGRKPWLVVGFNKTFGES